MGKIKKVATSKHGASVSPAFSDFIQKVSNAPLSQLPSHLASLERRWPFPRGDLYHWIGPLNRFDEILESFSSRYGLKAGPQVKAFGISQLLQGSEGADEDALRQLGFGPEGDRELVESILDFSRLLLEKCGNRNLYNSSDRMNELLNTSSLSLLHGTLRVALCLAQRYRDRLRSGHFQHPSLTSPYKFDMDRIEKLAQQIPKPPPDPKKLLPTSPVKTGKGKDKVARPIQHRTSKTLDPNDFRSLCGEQPNVDERDKKDGDQEADHENWEAWAQVFVKFPTSDNKKPDVENGAGRLNQQDQNGLSSPTPLRRPSSTGRSRLSRLSTSEDTNGHSDSAPLQDQRARPASDHFSPPISAIIDSPLGVVLESGLTSVPASMHYEVLHKLRVAYGLIQSSTTRGQLLAIRLLAIANLAYVLPDAEFLQKLFGQDRESGQRQQLVRQLVSLLYAGSDSDKQVPLFIQSHALETLGALTKQKSMISDVTSGLNVTANHGTLLYLVQQGLADLANDHDITDNVVGDEWRDGLFSLLKFTLDASPNATRNSDAFASPALMTAYSELLRTHTEKAQRLYLKVLEFLEAFTHHVKDGLATLLNNKTFEAVTDLLNYLVSSALKLVQDGHGFPSTYRTPSIDYQIPYLHQQSIRAILTFVNGVNGHQGGPADRVLRSLIDSHKLLDAFCLVVKNAPTFGAHTWSEVVKAMNVFLHNEPTSYTVIAEAGLSKSFLQSITLRDTEAASEPNGVQSVHSRSAPTTVTGLASADAAETTGAGPDLTSSAVEIVDSVVGHAPLGILPAAEAISNASQAFGAVCLTATGYEVFKTSGALETFFGVFLSAPHVKVMSDPNLLAVLGSTFDELVRHHPGMRPDILSMVLITLSRVTTLCRSMARTIGAGAKLWVSDGHNGLSVAGGNESLLHEMLPQAPADAPAATSARFPFELPNGNILTSYAPRDENPISKTMMPEEKDEHGLTVADYMTPIVGFLMSFFENQPLCTSFIDAGGVEFVLDLATMPSLPFDFFRAREHIGTSHDVAQVIHMMAETKPHLVLPSLVNRALSTCQHLEEFAHNQPHDMNCYFGILTRRPGEVQDLMETESNDLIRQNGTKIAKALTSIHFLTTILTETFESPIYSTRNPQPSFFTLVNLADLYAQLCTKLGKISAACIREEVTLQKNAPNSWLEATKPKDFETGNDDVDQLLGLDNAQEPPSEHVGVPAGNAQTSVSSPNTQVQSRPLSEEQTFAEDKKTPEFKNVVILRYLLTQLPSSITQFFSLLGRNLLTKRRLELHQKQNALMVAEAISGGLVAMLDPGFLRSPEHFQNRKQFLETRFAYLGVVLVNQYHVILDLSPSADFKQSITSVVFAFRNIGGLQLLKSIGEEFFDELKSCEVSDDIFPSLATANSGLKVTLDIFEHLTSAKCVVDSVQSSLLKNQDGNKPPYFVPAQFLLELRMEALPLSRMIWESDYADQASKAVIEKLVAILRHVLSGEQEDDAHKEGHDIPSRSTEPSRKPQPSPSSRDLETLIGQGLNEPLVREAFYRCNNNASNAEEYCREYKRDSARQRNPIPDYELDSDTLRVPRALRHSDRAEPTLSDQATQTFPVANDLPADGALPSAMSIDSLLNESENPVPEESPIARDETNEPTGITTPSELTKYTTASIESERKLLRENLTEQCLNILNKHHDVTFELSELILSATTKLRDDDANEFRQTASELVINSLISLQTDEVSLLEGSKVAAYSHLTALLLQDNDMYVACVGELIDTFNDLLGFVKIAQASSNQEPSPWIGHVLLIFEKMLSDDAEPRQILWTLPPSIDAPLTAAPPGKGDVLTPEQKKLLFEAVLTALPQIGKDTSLALSVARVLVILTRRREIAVLLGDKRNIQRLFVMIKQLANAVDDRLQSALLLILRHVVEDDDTLRQIMRSEIVANFDDSRSSRQTDITNYVRSMSHLVLRSPEIFIEVSNEKVKIQRYEPGRVPQRLVLKTEDEGNAEVEGEPASTDATEPAQSTVPTTEGRPEADNLDANQDNKSRTADIKAPVVEHPDGVIHFLLSELLSYKETEDKESSEGPNELVGSDAVDMETSMDIGNGNASDAASDFGAAPVRATGPHSRQPFKGEDHPIYIYRCFLLQCLTELLHSYNRTKIEFINFSRKADPLAMTPSKPRSGVLNYLLNGLIPIGSLDPDDSSVSFRKRTITSDWAMKVIVALCSKTGESGLIPATQRYSTYQRVTDNDDEPDLSFVRRFVLEHALRAFKDANSPLEALQVKYSRILCLADLFYKLISKPSGPEGTSGSSNNSHKTLSKLMFEKNFIAVLTSSLAEIDIAFPGSKRVVKHILKPLNELSQTAYHLSVTSPSPITSALGTSEEDVISSASSVSDVEDEREETPDLFRNSTLAMLEPHRQDDSSSESGEDDEEMYEGEYADDMEFEDGMPTVDPNDGEVVSDDDVDDDLHGAGPMEGLSGDVPMDLELVIDDPHMDVDTDEDDEDDEDEGDDEDDDDEDDEDDDDEDDEDDDDGQDFIVGADDAIMEGEINGDNENDSLDDGDDEGEGEWQSEDDEENGMDDGDAEDVEEILNPAEAVAPGDEANESGHDQLNNLLQILGEAGHDEGNITARLPGGLVGQTGIDDDMQGNDDGDEEEGDDLDENEEDMNYQTFNDMLNNDMLNDPDTHWPWDEAPPFLRGHGGHGGHHRHIRTLPGQMPSFMTRQITSHGMPMMPTIARSHRHAVPARATDDGTNPLLQRPGARPATTNAIPTPSDFVHGFNPGFTALFAPGSGHGGVIDAIMEAISRGDGRIDVTNHRHGQYDIRINASPQQFREFLRPPHPSAFSRSSRGDPYRAVSFTPSLTVTRWQEEARLLYGNLHDQVSMNLVHTLASVLVPPAIEEEKARIRKAEEDRKREEEERAERERQERLEREAAEKKQKEEEAREAAAKAEAEAIAAATAAAQAREASQSQDQPVGSTDGAEPMQDVQATGSGEVTTFQPQDAHLEAASVAGPSQPPARVYTTIRGRQLDITDLDIDAEFLEGLPEEIREEVIMTQYAERRNQAAEQGQPSSEISAEFLDALPEEIREELLQQDAEDRRRREREAAHRRATEAGGPARAEEMDADSFMATLDPSLRRAILAEQSDDILQQLAPQYAAEARALINRDLHQYGRHPVGREAREVRDAQEPSSAREPRKQVVQMVDSAGVATLMRLMFMSQQGSARQNLYRVLENVCGHRQTRTEVIRLLLLILKDGSADVSAVERSLAHLSLRAKTPSAQKTPQLLKRTLSLPHNAAGNDEMTPLLVVQQCLGAISALTQYNMHMASVFVRESERSSSMKSRASRKGKGKETRASKFPVNDLIGLLDRKLITDNSSCMESLAALLSTVTHPLTWMAKKDKATDEPKAEAAEASASADVSTSQAQPEPAALQPSSNIEVVEVEPTSPEIPSAETSTANLDTSSALNSTAAPPSASDPDNRPTVDDSDLKAVEVATEQEEDKAKRMYEPPEIPEHNLRLVVGILSARECNAKTFRDAVSTITNLSLIPDAREVFGKELVSQAQILSQSILADLDELLPSIRDAKSGTDIQNVATSRFSPASSDQAKLLRVLTALDYIFEPKRPENKDKVETEGSNPSEILISLYESPTFFPLWSKLSGCLSAMRERDSMVSAATILLPLIESLMLVCKNTSLKDAPIARHIREQSVTTPSTEAPNSLETLFFNFTTEHRKILNELVRQNSKLMSGSFSLLVKNPKVLEFDNKRSYFNRQVHARREARHPQPPLQLSVRRDQVFMDSFRSLYFKSADEMKYGKLSIRFHGEEGVDAGGVTREWFQVLARGMFNPNYALFIPVASDKTTFHPSRLSGVNGEHLMFFKFIGRIIGKALYENRLLDCHFSRAVYKRILGKPISIKDMESLDLDYYKSLLWILENDITDIITENFAVASQDFGEDRIIDLIENGRNIPVTEENKQEYVQLVTEDRLTGSVKEQLENFLRGFNDIIPAELISIFNEQELELLISGLPDIDVDDWKANTEYHTYTPSSPQIQWFWRAVAGFSSEERAKLLQFVTGTSKTPLNGFADLEGMNGITKFNIHKDFGNKDRLPSSHTCFNQLDLPEYDSYEDLKKALNTGFEQGSDYFGFA